MTAGVREMYSQINAQILHEFGVSCHEQTSNFPIFGIEKFTRPLVICSGR